MKEHFASTRFWEKVDIRGHNECWPWLAYTNGKGYGKFGTRMPSGIQKTYFAHRVSFCLARNYPLDYIADRIIRHTCDNPICANPSHLEIGSFQDNADDMVRRGREAHLRGGLHGRAKLSEDSVNEIRVQLRSGKMQKQIAEDFSVSQTAISLIKSGRRWAHTMGTK